MTNFHDYKRCGACSKLWNNINKYWTKVFDQRSWSINNGTTINAWSDYWLGNITTIHDLNT